MLRLEFSDATTMDPLMVVLNPTFFRDELHFNSFDSDPEIFIDDGGGLMNYALVGNFTTPLTGTTFDFKFQNAEFYIESITVTAVPLPVALPLFLLALAGLAFIGRRRGRQAAA